MHHSNRCTFTSVLVLTHFSVFYNCGKLFFFLVCTIANGVRLTGGTTAMDGQVDVCFEGTYSPVCNNGQWSVSEASVVCRQLGFSAGQTFFCKQVYMGRLAF